MWNLVKRYANWLQAGNPTGAVERLPEVREDGSTSVPGLFIVGDLTGIPLLKFATQTGANLVRRIAGDLKNRKPGAAADARGEEAFDVVIVGAGVAGVAAGMEAQQQGLHCVLLEAARPFSTIKNFPKRKPIYLYPAELDPHSPLEVSADVKEDLVDELVAQEQRAGLDIRSGVMVQDVKRSGGVFRVNRADGTEYRARRVVLAIGRSGNYRKLNVPGEKLGKVYNRLHDPAEFCGQDVLVVGGGDSALETAVALAECSATVTLSYRKAEFSRPKPENVHRVEDLRVDRPTPGAVHLLMGSRLQRIEDDRVVLTDANGAERRLPNESVFAMIGREPPLAFLRRCGVRISGEWSRLRVGAFLAFLAACTVLYFWKNGDINWPIPKIPGSDNPATLVGTIAESAMDASFWYTLAYCLCVVIFGLKRIARRKTQYITVQTCTLMAVQCVPLFILPAIVLPWMGAIGWIPATVADNLFPAESYWRAYGFILAWPLVIGNIATEEPLLWWLIIGFAQSFVIIPLIIYKWGKGAYCGWICSCGALAETLGDTHRHKAPHGPFAKRLDLAGQVILAIAVMVTALRMSSWIPGLGWIDPVAGLSDRFYRYAVDITLAGVVGLGFYFWFSGRTWCRFFCPLAALMHVYTKFSRYRIFSDKKKCISCNVCTSVCHMGIDVMNYANKGRPLDDVECVRCSACVQSCPTGVLYFGEAGPGGNVVRLPILKASPVRDGSVSTRPADGRGRVSVDRFGTPHIADQARPGSGFICSAAQPIIRVCRELLRQPATWVRPACGLVPKIAGSARARSPLRAEARRGAYGRQPRHPDGTR